MTGPKASAVSSARPEFGTWLAGLAWVMGLVFTVLATQGNPFLPADIEFKQKWLPLLALSAFIVVLRVNALRALLPFVNLGMVVVLAWTLLSFLWAPMPAFALTQAACIIGVSVIAVAFSISGWHPARFESLLLRGIMTLLLLSLLAGIVVPGVAIHSEDYFSLKGSWRGVTYQKNGLGQVAAVGMIVWTYCWAARRTAARWAAAGIGLSVLMLVLSRSSTSLMLAMLSCIGMVLLLRPTLEVGWLGRRAALLGVAVLVPLVAYLAVMTSTFAWIGGVFGKDGTFSGRTVIWDALLVEIAQRPFLGIGFANFWQGYDSPAGAIMRALHWPVPSGHNGYLDIVNDLGLIGLALFLSFLVMHSLALAKLARFDPQRFALHLALFVYVILANVSESGWFRPVELTHLLGMYMSLEVSRLTMAHYQHRQSLAREQRRAALEAALGPASFGAGAHPKLGARRITGLEQADRAGN